MNKRRIKPGQARVRGLFRDINTPDWIINTPAHLAPVEVSDLTRRIAGLRGVIVEYEDGAKDVYHADGTFFCGLPLGVVTMDMDSITEGSTR